MSWSFSDKLHAAMMRLRNPTAINRSNYKRLNRTSSINTDDGTTYTSSDEKNLIQRYWPCFAIISCALLFSVIIYTTIFLTEDKEYPFCELPESLLIPTEDQTYLTYIYPRDVGSMSSKINNKYTKNEKIIFYSTLKQLYNEQRMTIDLLEGHPQSLNTKNLNDIQYRFIEDCQFPALQNTENPSHCIKFQLVYASNRANKDNGHKTKHIDYKQGIVQEYDATNEHFNFHKIDPNELLMAISLNAHDFDNQGNVKKFFGVLREFVGLDNSEVEEMQNDENIGYFSCIDWHSTRNHHGFHAVFLNKYSIGNYSGLLVPDKLE